MKPSPAPDNEERDQEIIKLLQELGSIPSNYPAELLAARRVAFLEQVEQRTKVNGDEGLNPGDEKIVQLLGNLKPVDYPAELLAARRAAFLAQVDQRTNVNVDEGLNLGDEKIIQLLGTLKSAGGEYPAGLLAARRSAFLQQIGSVATPSFLDRLRLSIKSIFPRMTPVAPLPNLRRTSLVAAVLMLVALFGSLLFSRTEGRLTQPPLIVPTRSVETVAIVCKPGDLASSCSSRELNSRQDLAEQGNGAARPAVSKDMRSSSKAAYINDGRSDTSWVSNSTDSWVKIDLGKVTTLNTVTLQKGSANSSPDNNLGQFVIAVAQSDIYSDGNSSNDYMEYAPVFDSKQSGFSGTVSRGETVRTQFPSVKARFIKLTFAKAGAAVGEVGVFLVPPPELIASPTKTAPDDGISEVTASQDPTDTNSSLSTETSLPTATLVFTATWTPLPTDTPTSTPTDLSDPTATATPLPSDTPLPTDTPTPLPTNTQPPTATSTPMPTNTMPPTATSTPLPTDPLPSDTSVPSSTPVPPANTPTDQSLPASTEPIIVTSHDQILTFICNDNAVEVRGNRNTVTLFGFCSSITVTGNRNQVFWEFGSPIITNQGKENVISQR